MSKQIYIDSNGNEIQVSGTVNSADMLPIEAGSSKMTSEAVNEVDEKIDNATTKTSGTITATSGYTVRSQNLVKVNGVVFGSFAINATGTITSRTTIGTIPTGFRPNATVSFFATASSAINYYQDRATNVIIGANGEITVGDIVIPSGQSIKEIILTFSYNQGS